jgi:hypothetical protein
VGRRGGVERSTVEQHGVYSSAVQWSGVDCNQVFSIVQCTVECSLVHSTLIKMVGKYLVIHREGTGAKSSLAKSFPKLFCLALTKNSPDFCLLLTTNFLEFIYHFFLFCLTCSHKMFATDVECVCFVDITSC